VIEALKAIFEYSSKLPPAAIKTIIAIGLLSLSYTAFTGNERLSALETQAVRSEEQRRAETQAIRDLTDEVRSYRQAVLEEARRVASARNR